MGALRVSVECDPESRSDRVSGSRAIYAYPRLGRIDTPWFGINGPGLGNMLHPWTRCLVQAHRRGWCPVRPSWDQIHPRRLVRGVRDQRRYGAMMQRLPFEIDGGRRLRLLLGARRVPEECSESVRPGTVVVFEGMREEFAAIEFDRSRVAKCVGDLLGWSQRSRQTGAYIAVHVRLGDFELFNGDPADLQHSTRLPFGWYVRAANAMRQRLGKSLPVRVFSDGSPDELSALLTQIPDSTLAASPSPAADLGGMAGAAGLVASASSFSQWAAFLGEGPVIWAAAKFHPKGYSDPQGRMLVLAPDADDLQAV